VPLPEPPTALPDGTPDELIPEGEAEPEPLTEPAIAATEPAPFIEPVPDPDGVPELGTERPLPATSLPAVVEPAEGLPVDERPEPAPEDAPLPDDEAELSLPHAAKTAVTKYHDSGEAKAMRLCIRVLVLGPSMHEAPIPAWRGHSPRKVRPSSRSNELCRLARNVTAAAWKKSRCTDATACHLQVARPRCSATRQKAVAPTRQRSPLS